MGNFFNYAVTERSCTMKAVNALPQNWSKTTFWLLILFTLANTFATLIGEAFKTHLIWYFRFADLVEILVNSAFYLISLVLFFELFWQVQASPGLRRLFATLIILFFIGHVMHFTANTTNVFGTEIRDYKSIIPQDLYALIYFMDETLSHIILYLSRYGLLACLLVLETGYLVKHTVERRLWVGGLIVGLLFGLWEAIVFIEGQKVWLVPVAIILLGATWIWTWRKSGSSIGTFIKTGPITAFVTVELPCLLIGLVVYLLIFGRFVEPSQLGG
jgi:hypothetical protein